MDRVKRIFIFQPMKMASTALAPKWPHLGHGSVTKYSDSVAFEVGFAEGLPVSKIGGQGIDSRSRIHNLVNMSDQRSGSASS